MTTLLKNASYLKVSHSGQTTGSLLLADLADEENAKQEKKIPVYVPENGSITIPLDEDVLLSYQQGTIRGLEDQGYVSTTLLSEPSLIPEIWVAPEGDDTNPGTREAPYASIQKAHNDLRDQFGDGVRKTIILKEGEYREGVIINSKNVTVKSAVGVIDSQRSIVYCDGTTGPAFFITNMTEDAARQFISEGGLNYTAGTTGSFDYTGASLKDRDERFPGDDASMAFKLLDVYPSIDANTMDAGAVGIAAAASFTDATPEVNLFDLKFKTFVFNGGGDTDLYTSNVYFKNCTRINFGGNVRFGIVYDQCQRIAPIVYDGNDGGIYRAILRLDVDSNNANEPTTRFASATNSMRNLDAFAPRNVSMYTSIASDFQVGNTTRKGLRTLTGDRLELNHYAGLGNPTALWETVSFDYIDINDNATLNAQDVLCSIDLTKGSVGDMKISTLECGGNVTISGGTSNVINGGTIEGNLTVNAPATVDLTNVVVKGNLEGDGDITMTGGGYGGANNNTGTFTYNALGTT